MPAPSGWMAWVGWVSCWGSPSSTSDRAAGETATALARENCPASSTTSTSTDPRRSSRAQSQAEPPTSVADRDARAATTSSLVPARRTPSTSRKSSRSHFCSAGRSTASSRWLTTACDCAVTPTRRPWSSSARIIAAPLVVLPDAGRALDGEHLTVEGEPGPDHLVDRLLPRQRRQPGRHPALEQAQPERGPAGEHLRRDVGDRLLQDLDRRRLGRPQTARGRRGPAAPDLEHQPAGGGVHLEDLADLRLGVDVQRLALARADLGVLRRELVAPPLGLLDVTVVGRRGQLAERRGVVQERLVVEVLQPVDVPPLRALLAPVPADDAGQQRGARRP